MEGRELYKIIKNWVTDAKYKGFQVDELDFDII